MFNYLKISLFYCILLLNCTSIVFAQKIDIGNYKNKAQAYAILSAQYSNDVYKITRQNYFIDDVVIIKQNADSAVVLTQIASNYADSAYNIANDSCVFAKNLLMDVKAYQLQVLEQFQQVVMISDNYSIHILTSVAMYAIGNAVTDAYRASLELDWNEVETIAENKKNDNKRDATRLETDEASFTTIKELYGKRLAEIAKELVLLEAEKNKSTGQQKIEISNVIAQLKAEQKELLSKSKNSDDKLIKVKNDLSEEMLKVVNKDFFTTEKTGFYNDKVPIPSNSDFPKGLIYRVQIGFFKSQLPSKHFDGVFPISSQKVDDNYYRYTAGNFKNYADAKEAKISLRKKGYADAFVVSFIDGIKVPISDALIREKEEK